MAPKKKSNKKADEDWEADLGETVDPNAVKAPEVPEVNATKDMEEDGSAGGGGLMAAIRKNKSKKQKKGKVVEEDYVEGEDPPEANGLNGHPGLNGIDDLAAKAPEDATADDLFDAQFNKVKGGKGKQGRVEEKPPEEDGDSADEGSKMKSKKEKEKEKKERERLRKKEQVCIRNRVPSDSLSSRSFSTSRLQRRNQRRRHRCPKMSHQSQYLKLNPRLSRKSNQKSSQHRHQPPQQEKPTQEKARKN